MSEVELVCDARATLGEGPLWDDRAHVLWWLDIEEHELHRFDPATGEDRHVAFEGYVGAIALREHGGLMAAHQDGFAELSETGALRHVTTTERDRPGNRMNDGKVDPRGRFWAGTMALDLTPGIASLYRLDPDGQVYRMLDGVGLSNGLGWSPAGDAFYFIDSLEYAVDAFDYDAESGAISNRRRLVDLRDTGALPDGMTVDADGFLWVALYRGGALHRYSPKGRLDGVLALPVSQPTSCAFGGDDLGDLYVTTAAQERSPEQLAEEPAIGGLFRARPGVTGLPTPRLPAT